MARGKKNKLQDNPFYPERKESLLKEIGTTVGVVVVCIILVGLIVKFFNVYAIEERKGEKDYQQENDFYEADSEYPVYDDEYQYEESENYENDYSEEYQQEVIINEQDDVQQAPLYDEYGNVIQEELHQQEVIEDDAYIIPDSSTRYLSYADLDGLTADELRIARNEIYARHGRMFKDAGLQAYFDAQPWYTGTIPADNFTQSMLSAIEVANAELISNYEASKGF